MQAASRASLCNLVEDDLTGLIREAATVQRHSRRGRFRPVLSAAASSGGRGGGGGAVVDPNTPAAAAAAGKVGVGVGGATGGVGVAVPKRRRLLHADDINLALSYRGSDRLYLTNAGQLGPPTVTIGRDDDQLGGGVGSGGGDGDDDDDDVKSSKRKDRNTGTGGGTGSGNGPAVDLNAYLRTEMTLRPPSEIGLRSHWLAVDGVQPDIPENPGGAAGAAAGPGGAAAAAVVGLGVGAVAAMAAAARDSTVHRVEDDEDLEAVAAAADGSGVPGDHHDGGPPSKGGGAAIVGVGTGAGGGSSSGSVSVRQLLPRLLSEELRLYFTRITLAVERGTPSQVEAALTAIGRDSGIQELVPFFVRFISRQVYDNIGRVEYCRTLVRLAGKLVDNPHLHLELNLHQLLPPLITCVVARRLASDGYGGGVDGDGGGGGNHWALREEAAGVLMSACSTFGEQYTTLKARVLRTLCEALSPDMPLTTQYGGLVGISRFGPKAVDAFLLPLATPYWTRWDDALQASQGNNIAGRFEIQQCQRALLDGLASFMRSASPEEQSQRVDWDAMFDVFGERLIPLRAEPSDYVDCFV